VLAHRLTRLALLALGLGLFAWTCTDAQAEPRRFFVRVQAERAQDAEPLPTPSPGYVAPQLDPPSAPSWSDVTPSYEVPSYGAWQGSKAFQKGAAIQRGHGGYQKSHLPAHAHVKYVHHRGHCRACCAKSPPLQTVLTVENPRTKCPVAVPVCIPSCCVELAGVHGRCGLLGRGIVHYEWCCGFSLKVVFDRFGDATVHYYGA